MFVSGAEQRRCERPDLYRKLLDGPQDAQLVELIKIGLFRKSFHIFVSSVFASAKEFALEALGFQVIVWSSVCCLYIFHC